MTTDLFCGLFSAINYIQLKLSYAIKNKPRRESSSGEILIRMITLYVPDWSIHLSPYFRTCGDRKHGKDDAVAQAEKVR